MYCPTSASFMLCPASSTTVGPTICTQLRTCYVQLLFVVGVFATNSPYFKETITCPLDKIILKIYKTIIRDSSKIQLDKISKKFTFQNSIFPKTKGYGRKIVHPYENENRHTGIAECPELNQMVTSQMKSIMNEYIV